MHATDTHASRPAFTHTYTYTYTYTYEEIPPELVTESDLRVAISQARDEGHEPLAYFATILDPQGLPLPERVTVLQEPAIGRVGIRWCADADWYDSEGDIEADLDRFVGWMAAPGY